MPQIKSSEKRLLIGLGIAVFVIANVFGFIMVSRAMTGIEISKKKLSGRLASLEEDKARSAEADEKGAWIAANLRPYGSDAEREVYWNDLVGGALTTGLDVEISKNAPMATIESAYFVKSRYRMAVKGPWPDVRRFLWRMQKPEDFHFVKHMSMVPKKSELDDSVHLAEVTVELEKWWPKPEDLTGTEGAPEENVEQPGTAPVESTAAPSGETPATATPAESTPPESPPAPESTPPAPDVPAPATPAPEIPTDPPKPNP